MYHSNIIMDVEHKSKGKQGAIPAMFPKSLLSISERQNINSPQNYHHHIVYFMKIIYPAYYWKEYGWDPALYVLY